MDVRGPIPDTTKVTAISGKEQARSPFVPLSFFVEWPSCALFAVPFAFTGEKMARKGASVRSQARKENFSKLAQASTGAWTWVGLSIGCYFAEKSAFATLGPGRRCPCGLSTRTCALFRPYPSGYGPDGWGSMAPKETVWTPRPRMPSPASAGSLRASSTCCVTSWRGSRGRRSRGVAASRRG